MRTVYFMGHLRKDQSDLAEYKKLLLMGSEVSSSSGVSTEMESNHSH